MGGLWVGGWWWVGGCGGNFAIASLVFSTGKRIIALSSELTEARQCDYSVCCEE